MEQGLEQVDVASQAGWREFLAWMPSGWEEQMVQRGAFVRARGLKRAEDLLRIIFAYTVLRLSLASLCRWAQQEGLGGFSEPSLWARFHGAEEFLSWLVGALLRPMAPLPAAGLRLIAVDATSFSLPASVGKDWLVHCTWSGGQAVGLRVCQARGEGAGESIKHLPQEWPPGSILVGDRAYGTASQLQAATTRGLQVINRFSWNHLALYTQAVGGELVNPRRQLAKMRAGQVREISAWVRPPDAPPLAVRVILIRKGRKHAERAARACRHESQRKGRTVRGLTLYLAGYVTLVTTVPGTVASAQEIADAYRWRWQIELAFKQFKSTTLARRLPVKNTASVAAYLLALLAAWLITMRISRERFFFPWGVPLQPARRGR